jgi:hypothetical protein
MERADPCYKEALGSCDEGGLTDRPKASARVDGHLCKLQFSSSSQRICIRSDVDQRYFISGEEE